MVTKGLGLLPARVTRLQASVVPHMGWNTVSWPEGTMLGAGLDESTRFYFVHSYAGHAQSADGNVTTSTKVAIAEHGEPFIAAVEQGVLSATQFHPEKSGDAGATLLSNWIGTL